jgi:squalene-associated FAD-dependent desaturase
VSTPDVLVVGGGLAGIAAALTAADAGASVMLLESRPTLGGATASFRRGDLAVDTGQHVFLRCCTEYLKFLDRIGMAGQVVIQPRLHIPVRRPGGEDAELTRSNAPAPLHLASALLRYRHLSRAERLSAARAALAMKRLDPHALDTQTFAAWLREHRQSQRAIDRLWDLLCVATLNTPADKASLALAAKVVQTGLLERADAADIGVANLPLGELHGSAGRRALEQAGCTILRERAEQLLPGRVRTARQEISAGAIIVAVPHDVAARLLPTGAVATPLAALGVSPIINIHVVYDRRVMVEPMMAVVDSEIQWVFDRTTPSGLRSGQYLAVSLSAADEYVDTPAAALRDTFLPALAAVFPAACSAEVRDFFVTRERAATFRQHPGCVAFRPGTRTNVTGLFLAGAWTDTGWPATMEGAVRSGTTAARAALGAPVAGPPHPVPEEAVA